MTGGGKVVDFGKRYPIRRLFVVRVLADAQFKWHSVLVAAMSLRLNL